MVSAGDGGQLRHAGRRPLWWRAPPDSSAVPWALAIETEPDDCKVTGHPCPLLHDCRQASHVCIPEFTGDLALDRFTSTDALVLRMLNGVHLQIDVREGDSAEQLLEALSGPLGPQRAVYELTAVIAHIRDQDEPPGDSATADGHLLAHIKARTTPRTLQQPLHPCLPADALHCNGHLQPCSAGTASLVCRCRRRTSTQTAESPSHRRRRRRASRPGRAEAALLLRISDPLWTVPPAPRQAPQQLPVQPLQTRVPRLIKRLAEPM